MKIAWAALCPGALLLMGFIHLALAIASMGRLFCSLTSLRLSLLARLTIIGIWGTKMENVCLIISASGANPVVKISSMSLSCSQSITLLSLKRMVKPPLHSLLISRIEVSVEGAG